MPDTEVSTRDPSKSNSTSSSTLLYLTAGLVAVSLATGMAMVASSKPAGATAAYSAQTGLPCGRCHVATSGGGKLTSFGAAWARKHK